MYAPAEVSGRVQFLDRAQDIVHQADEQCDRAGVHAEVFREGPEAAVYHVPGDVPRQITGPEDHRDQDSDGDADQAEFQDEGSFKWNTKYSDLRRTPLNSLSTTESSEKDISRYYKLLPYSIISFTPLSLMILAGTPAIVTLDMGKLLFTTALAPIAT